MCRTTGWSEWSPCSKSCGRGRKARYRSLLSQSNITSEKQSIEMTRSIERRCHHVNLVEERVCGDDQPPCEDRLYHPPSKHFFIKLNVLSININTISKKKNLLSF